MNEPLLTRRAEGKCDFLTIYLRRNNSVRKMKFENVTLVIETNPLSYVVIHNANVRTVFTGKSVEGYEMCLSLSRQRDNS